MIRPSDNLRAFDHFLFFHNEKPPFALRRIDYYAKREASFRMRYLFKLVLPLALFKSYKDQAVRDNERTLDEHTVARKEPKHLVLGH